MTGVSTAVVALHLFAAIAWIGGMIFLSLVFAPLIRRRTTTADSIALFRSAALRFRPIVWSAMVILLTTGPLLLSHRGIPFTTPSAWPPVLMVKLGLVALLLVITLSHDLLLGPKVSRLRVIPEAARTDREQMLIRAARWLPRLSLLVALAVVVAAIVLARS